MCTIRLRVRIEQNRTRAMRVPLPSLAQWQSVIMIFYGTILGDVRKDFMFIVYFCASDCGAVLADSGLL